MTRAFASFILVFLTSIAIASAQNYGTVHGTVRDSIGEPVIFVTVPTHAGEATVMHGLPCRWHR